MADQVNYTGASYNEAYARGNNESLFDYMQRLAKMRAGGTLGGGGMLDPAVKAQIANDAGLTNEELGVLLKKPVVPVSSGGDGEVVRDTRTAEEKLRDAVAHQSGTKTNWAGALMSVLPTGLFGTVVNGLMNSSERDIIEAQLADRYSPEQIDAIMNDEQALADMYASGAIVNNPLTEDFNPAEARSSFGYIIDNPIDYIGNALGFDMYGDGYAGPKVYGAPDYLPQLPSVMGGTSVVKSMFPDYQLLSGVPDTPPSPSNGLLQLGTVDIGGTSYNKTYSPDQGLVYTSESGGKMYGGGGNQGWTSPSNSYPDSKDNDTSSSSSVGSGGGNADRGFSFGGW